MAAVMADGYKGEMGGLHRGSVFADRSGKLSITIAFARTSPVPTQVLKAFRSYKVQTDARNMDKCTVYIHCGIDFDVTIAVNRIRQPRIYQTFLACNLICEYDSGSAVAAAKPINCAVWLAARHSGAKRTPEFVRIAPPFTFEVKSRSAAAEIL